MVSVAALGKRLANMSSADGEINSTSVNVGRYSKLCSGATKSQRSKMAVTTTHCIDLLVLRPKPLRYTALVTICTKVQRFAL